MTARHRGQRWGLHGPDGVDPENLDGYRPDLDPGSHSHRASRAGGTAQTGAQMNPLHPYGLGGLERQYRTCPWCAIACCAFHDTDDAG